MKNERDISETIEAYLANSLSSEDKIAFENRLQNEPDLAKNVADEKALSNLLLENELFSLRDQMKSDFQANKSRLFKLKAIGVIAIFAIVAVGVFMALPKEESIPISEIMLKEDAFSDSSKKDSFIYINNTSYKKTGQKTKIVEETISKKSVEEVVLAEKSVQEIVQQAPHQVSENVIQPEKQEVEKTKPCAEKGIEAHFQTKASEKGQQNGSIQIQLTREQARQYLYSLNKESGFSEKSDFEHLAKGNYEIFAQSADGCVHSLGQTIVKETLCVGDYKKSFSPEFDPTWVVPVFENESAKVLIKDKTGMTAFETNHFSTSETSWDGNLPSGAMAVTGSYKVFISYQNGENCIATVTLFR